MKHIKWVALMLAAVMVFAVACGDDEKAAAPTAAPKAEATKPLTSASPTAVATQVTKTTTSDRFGGELKVVSQSSVSSIDRDFSNAYVSAASSMHITEGLFKLDRDFVSKPEVAEKWELSSDGKTYTFTIRDDRVFHNSDRVVTTDDVIPSMRRWIIRHPGGKALQNFIVKAEDTEHEKGLYDKNSDPGFDKAFEKVSDTVFKLHLTEPYGSVVTHWGLLRQGPLIWPGEIAVLSPSEDVGEDNIIGSGPYRLDKWVRGDKLTYARHEGYIARTEPISNYAGAQTPYLDKLSIIEVPDEETKMAGLKTGEWHIVDGASLDNYIPAVESPELEVALDIPGKASNIIMVHGQPWIDNLKFRLAIQASIDVGAFMSALGPDDAWMLCPALFHCEAPLASDVGSEYYNQNDPELAKKLLEEAGYDGSPLIILNTTDYATITPMGPVFVETLKNIGVNIQMPANDWATVVSKFRLDGHHFISNWSGFYGVHDPLLDGVMQGTSPSARYDNKEVQQLALDYAYAQSFEEQLKIAEDIQMILYEDAWRVNLGQFFALFPYRKEVKGFTEVRGMPNYAGVWLED